MFENKKMCPKCGSIEPDDHLFCSQCGAKLDITFDNEEKDDDEKKASKTHPVILFVILLAVLYFIISTVVSNFLSKIGSEVNNDMMSDESAVDKCSEFEIKSLAIESFKQKDFYYRYLLPKSISNVYLNDTAETSHFLDSNKYYCRGTIEVLSEVNGFEPTETTEENPYYSMIFHSEENPVKEYLDKYTSYTCEIEYTVENPDGSVKVEASYCGSGKLTDNAPPPEFSCEGICEPLILKEEQPEEENADEEKSDEIQSEEKAVDTLDKQEVEDTKTVQDNNQTSEITNETKIRESIEHKKINSEIENPGETSSDTE